MSEIRGIDLKNGLALLSNNAALYERLLKKFVDSTYYGELVEAVAGGAPADIAVKAHTLKGLAGNMSMTDLYEASLALELAGKAGEMITAGSLSMVQLTEVYQYTRASAVSLLADPGLIKA